MPWTPWDMQLPHQVYSLYSFLGFSKEHKNMLAHCKEILEHRNGQVAIHHCITVE